MNSILGRLKSALGLSTDMALAERLGVAQNTMSMWKARGILDYEKLIPLCEQNGLSLDWIISGRETAPGVAESRMKEMQQKMQSLEDQIAVLQDTIVRISTARAGGQPLVFPEMAGKEEAKETS